MPPFIGQIFFEEQVGTREAGWSEQHYLIGAGTLPEALDALSSLATLRANLLGAGCEINYLRVSDATIFRDSQVFGGITANFGLKPAGPGGRPTVVPSTSPGAGSGLIPGLYNNGLASGILPSDTIGLLADQPEVGYLVRLEAGTPFVSRRSLLLRGIPDGITLISSDGPLAGNNPMSANWLDAFTVWVIKMIGGNYGMRVINVAGANAQKPISSIVVDPISNVVSVFSVGTTYAVGDTVKIRGVKIPAPNGAPVAFHDTLTVVAAAAGGPYQFISLNPNSPFTTSATFKGVVFLSRGTIQLVTYTYVPYVKAVGRHWSSRKVGLPFDPFHGRHKKSRSVGR